MSNKKEIVQNFLPKDKKQWIIFLSCVFVSTVLWTLLKFSEEREEVLNVNLEFVNLPESEMLVGEVPDKLRTKIKAQGFGILSKSIGINAPELKIDVSTMKKIQKDDVVHYVWVPNHHNSRVKSAIGGDISELSFLTDTIKLSFSPSGVKELLVGFKYELTNQSDLFALREPLVSPLKVKVRGPKYLLNGMDSIFTEKAVFEKLESDLDQDFVLAKTKGIDSIYADSVRVFMGVESIDKHEFKIEIGIANKPDSLEVKLFPSEVTVSFVCGSNDLPQVLPSSFKPIVDFKDVNSSFKKLSVELEEIPSVVKDVRIEPFSVEYILKSKD